MSGSRSLLAGLTLAALAVTGPTVDTGVIFPRSAV